MHILLSKNHTVIAFDTKPPPPPDAPALPDGLTYIQGDARNYEEVTKAMEGCDAVVQLAALLPLAFGQTDAKDKVHNLNVVISWNVLRAAAEVRTYPLHSRTLCGMI